MAVFTGVTKEQLASLDEFGFYEVPVKTPYEAVRLQGRGVQLVLFFSGKLLVQGKDDATNTAIALLKKENVGSIVRPSQFIAEHGVVIGSDESLKGDTFGGLVVAGVRADDAQRAQLILLGAADSKTLKDEEVLAIASLIEHYATVEIQNIYPEEYNAFSGGQTMLLNKLHKEVYRDLRPGRHVVDKFPGCAVGDVAVVRAESKYVEVAAASVIARAHALKQLQDLSLRAGFTVPKGSTHVAEALEELKRRRLDFKKFVKVGFGNVKKILGRDF